MPFSPSPKKVLVAYFSHSGNTRAMAEFIKETTGGDLFEIQPVENYPTNYQTVVNQAKKEINSNFKPALKTVVADIDPYDFIFVGSPNWWSTIAPPVATFLSSHDLKDKTIVPFITHGGGGAGHCAADIANLCPQSTIAQGFVSLNNSLQRLQDEVNQWLCQALEAG